MPFFEIPLQLWGSVCKLDAGKVQDIRLVYGGVAPVSLRASEAEAYPEGKS
ncbi:MAG: hypothetical protein HFG22_02585 [Lachnospiraceae bacterium]|nr:hypothetical protein [Lachnospiraceae bacterium]